METLTIAPLRELDDFLVGSAKFQPPNVADLKRWHNRVINNLIYYQTNYFVLMLVTFFVVGYCAPVEMLLGIISTCLMFLAYVVSTDNQRELKAFKQKHPLISLILVMASVYFITNILGSVGVFFVGVVLPTILTFIHASCRLRNVKNKVSQFKEFVGLRRTPMGLILESLGQEQEAGS